MAGSTKSVGSSYRRGCSSRRTGDIDNNSLWIGHYKDCWYGVTPGGCCLYLFVFDKKRSIQQQLDGTMASKVCTSLLLATGETGIPGQLLGRVIAQGCRIYVVWLCAYFSKGLQSWWNEKEGTSSGRTHWSYLYESVPAWEALCVFIHLHIYVHVHIYC